MVPMMNNDFDMEKNEETCNSQIEKCSRVLNDVNCDNDNVRDEKLGALHLNDEIRVSLGDEKSEGDEIRVLGEGDGIRVLDGEMGGGVDGVAEMNGVRVSERNDGGGDGESEVKVEVVEDRGGEDVVIVAEMGVGVGGNEVKIEESKRDVGFVGEKVRRRSARKEGRLKMDGRVCGFRLEARGDVQGSMSKDGSPIDVDGEVKIEDSKGGIESVGEKVRRRGVRRDEGLKMDGGRVSDFRLEARGDVQGSVSEDGSATDVDDEMRADSLKVVDSRFEIGDMVWGKVKSHPWWPGHLFNEAFANSSVRRTRRHGHMLVAFFGDSSYGWFDPTELVPYDPHYAEKAEQTTSKNFVRAVEESVDEVSKRSALGLSCCCRNPGNFRPVNVPGYVSVDVVNYECGSIYSLSQIQKARENFRPFDALSFIKQLAVAPTGGEIKNLDFIKNKAVTLAYRTSKFEEFDETYAEAFNQQPIRLPQGLPDKEPSRAPLSGPLVIADALGGQKSSSKSTKTKDQSKKDRYLLKRRDKAGDAKIIQTAQVHATSSFSAYEVGASDTAANAYVFQKRELDVSNVESGGASLIMDQLGTPAPAGPTKDAPVTGIVVMEPSFTQVVATKDAPITGTIVMAPSGSQVLVSPVLTADLGNVPEKVPERHLEIRDGMMVKKKKTAKRTVGEQSFEKSDRPEKKMKKMKKKDGLKSIEHGERDSVLPGVAVKSAQKSMEIGAPFREDSQGSQLKKDTEAINSGTSQVGLVQLGIGDRSFDAELLQMLTDLRGLALNPFHGTERNGPAVARQFFLKFRSLVYLKSSSASPPAESESGEVRAIKSAPGSEPSEKPSTEGGKAASSLKLQKFSARLEDPAKGQKRIPSERLEEKAAKRAKKITEVKALSSEKRALPKNPELQQRSEGKPKVAAAPNLQSKSTSKSEQREKKPRVQEPTYLIMKFQSTSSLPSIVELKARFARFGPLDVSLSRVFYKTNTCRVAFLYKQDASVAHRYAMGSKSLFSNVKFVLKPVAAPEPQQPSSGNKVEDVPSDTAANRDSPASEARPVHPTSTTQQVTPQLKSCLKKPSGGDETGGANIGEGNARTARVRFNIGEVKGGSTDNRGGLQGPKMESRNSMLSSNEGPSSQSSLSVAMDISNNNQRLNVSSHPLQPPLLPLPQFIRAPINHQFHHHMVEPSPQINVHDNYPKIIPPPPLPESQAPAPPPRDISQQMMSLLTRCHDVVTNVKSILGYVPYHPL